MINSTSVKMVHHRKEEYEQISKRKIRITYLKIIFFMNFLCWAKNIP